MMALYNAKDNSKEEASYPQGKETGARLKGRRQPKNANEFSSLQNYCFIFSFPKLCLLYYRFSYTR
jgi:hypothetical protein